MIKILIIDDEPSAGNLLKILIERHIHHEKEVVYIQQPSVALEFIKEYKPSLIMLDIEMPGMNGFDFLNQVEFGNFEVIFTTAYDRYAIKAIRFSALDYLLKPIDISELQNAINKHIIHKDSIRKDVKENELINNLIGNLNHADTKDFKLALPTTNGVFFFITDDIIRLEGDGNYTNFYFNNHKPILISKTLKDYEEILADYNFIRVHKSHLINKKYVERLDNENVLWLKNGSSIIVSRRRRGDVLAELAA